MTNSITIAANEQQTITRRKRGCLTLIRRGAIWLSVILIVLCVVGVAYQTLASDQSMRTISPRGQLYDVNGHKMHLVCMGEGTPTVILQAGGAAESLYWYWVQNQLALQTRVCAFDRPGHGWSEPVSTPRDAMIINTELHTLLAEAGIAPPYVMAGHSFGAVWTRIFAAQYPEEIAGIVLVDSVSMPQPFADQGEFDQWKAPQNVFQTAFWVAYRTGIVRLLGPGLFQTSGYPAEITPEMTALQARNLVFDADYAEVVHGMRTFASEAGDAEHLGDLPMMILWAGQGPLSGDLRSSLRDEVASFSRNSTVRIIDGADHGSILGNEQYAQHVTDAILAVIRAAQTGDPLAQ